MPPLLIVDSTSGGAIKNGIELGYYPDYSKQVQNGGLVVITPKEAKKYALKSQPTGNGNDFYVSNPSGNNYIPMLSENRDHTLIVDRCFAVKEALVWMGAKDIVLNSEVKDTDSITTKFNANFKKVFAKIGNLGGNANVDVKKNSVENIKSYIESHDPERQPKSAEKVREFMIGHGLANDANLMLLLDRLKEDGALHGTEKYVITYLSEVDSAVSVAANVDCTLFNCNVNFSHLHKHVKSFSKEIEINFG